MLQGRCRWTPALISQRSGNVLGCRHHVVHDAHPLSCCSMTSTQLCWGPLAIDDGACEPRDQYACRRAWKRAALQTHPDKTGSTEPFIRVTAAYKALMATC